MKKLCVAISILLIIMIAYSTGVFAGNPGETRHGAADGAKGAQVTGSAVTSGTAVTSGAAVTRNQDGDERDKGGAESLREFAEAVRRALKRGQAEDNGNLVITITRPENDRDSTYYKTYNITGKSDFNDVVVSVFRFDEAIGEYIPITNTDGEGSWECSAGLFSTDILLEMGANKIMLQAYRKSEMKASRLQINCFTIERLPREVAESIVKAPAEKRQGFKLDSLQ